MVYVMRTAVAAMLLVAGSGAAAQPRIAAPPGQWTVDFGDKRCSLARRTGGAGSPIFILSSFLGRDEPEILMLRDGDERLPNLPSRVRIVLEPSGVGEEARVVRSYANRGAWLRIEGIAEGFFDRFAAAQSVQVVGSERASVTLRTPGAARAVAALRSCNDSLMSSWGVDLALRATLTRQATPLSGVINNVDYPKAAIEAGQSGISVVRFQVTADGTLNDCRTVVSSGFPILDDASCRLLTNRFRYTPALDASGRPVAVGEVKTIHWILP